MSFRARFLAMSLLAACSPTAGEGGDAGADEDAGARDDGGVEDDAGTPRDAGPEADAGAPSDAGPPFDAGPLGECVTVEAEPAGASWEDDNGRAEVSVSDRASCGRTYTLRTTADLRDDRPDNPRIVAEQPGEPTVRSGHDLFDALHALALEEVRELSVESIRDFAFNDGAGVDCPDGGCFETGRLWNYVWTRDTAYAVDLGLAPMDPTRARNSLEFKLSERREGGDLQVVQDTGTGGSYPVSSDRVSWALGAWTLLQHLDGDERTAFRDRALEALRNTAEHDRAIVFDPRDGLYRGEQSFLDWREQTYPEWTAGDVVHIGMSKALGTNLLHLRALEVTAALAEEAGDDPSRYAGWADDLRAAIRDVFWLEDEGLFSTYVTTELDPAPVRRYDLLSSAFAVLFGVATDAQAERILESYPHYGPGGVVVWPQQQLTRIYHNRGEWPFVTAYWLRAAKAADNDAVAERMVNALVRGAAINLSNMENFEAASGAAWVDEGDYSGPVVNSQRQLWSVAGYLSMVHHTVFGLEAEPDGLHVRPYVTAGMRSALFGGSDELVLNDYPYRGRRVTVVVHLPEAGGEGRHVLESVALNGTPLDGDLLPEAMLLDDNRVDVTLGAASGGGALTEVDDADWQNVFGPRTPRITGASEAGGRVVLALDPNGEDTADVTWSIYRDGERIASDLPGTTTSFTDPSHDASSARSPCYTAELSFTSSGNHSQHAPPYCWWGAGAARIQTVGAASMSNVGGTGVTNHGRFHYEGWGAIGHTLTASFTATQSGTHLVQATFGNGAGSVTTGITCGHKRVTVYDDEDTEVGGGYLVMPHLGEWSRWADSSFVPVELEAGRTYRVVLSGDGTSVNMSAFSHFGAYTGGLGGSGGAYYDVNVAELKLLAR